MIETVYNDDKSILIKCKIDENRIYITASPTELYPETVFKTASWFRGQHILLEIVASLNTTLTIDTFYSRRILCHLVRKIPNHTLVQLEAFGGHPAHKKIYECESVSKSPDAMRDELIAFSTTAYYNIYEAYGSNIPDSIIKNKWVHLKTNILLKSYYERNFGFRLCKDVCDFMCATKEEILAHCTTYCEEFLEYKEIS